MTDVTVDEIHIFYDATKSSHRAAAEARRTWRIAVTVNDKPKQDINLHDPLSNADYAEYLDKYVGETSNTLWCVKWKTAPTDNGLPALHREVKEYGNALLRGLGLDDEQVLKGLRYSSKRCTIHIREKEKESLDSVQGPSIHCLHWELLESADLPPSLRNQGYEIKVIREISFVHKLPIEAKEQLEEVQKDWSKSFKILLVLARKFIQPKDKKPSVADEADPHLAQWTLMDIQDKLVHKVGPHRLMLDIVRPSSKKELREHLERRKQQGLYFNLVHFDLHGGFTEADASDEKHRPILSFEKTANTEKFLDGQSLEYHRTEAVASILEDYRIENVVLNACESAYERHGRHANMCRLFIKHNVRFALGMWPKVNALSVENFLSAFYNSLLVDHVDFETSVQNARLKLREDEIRWPAGSAYLDDFVSVQYTRYPRQHLKPRYLSRLDFRNIYSVSSRNRSRNLAQPLPRPFIKLDLLTLELEYYMRTRKIIYAYDEPSRQAEMTRKIKGMAHIWLRTNLINNVFFYNADHFETKVAGRYKEIFDDIRRSSLPTPKPHKASDYTLHIIEGIDAAVDGISQTPEKMAAAKDHFQKFFNDLAWDRTYLIILTVKGEGWWNTQTCQEWTGKKTGIVWFHGKPYYRPVQHSGSHPSY